LHKTYTYLQLYSNCFNKEESFKPVYQIETELKRKRHDHAVSDRYELYK